MRMGVPLTLAAAVLVAAAPATASAAAAPPPGSLVQQFALNQLQNCAAICPFAVQGALTVPVGAAAAPLAFLRSVAATGNPLAALGAGAAAVTGPADAAMTGIIGNDLNQVVPRFQNGVLIAIVDLMKVADGTGSVGGFRSDLLAALQQPLPPVAPTPPPLTTPGPFGIVPTPRGPVQVAVVEATNVFFAAAFYIPELSLLGLTQAANAAATTLASTGDPVAATAAGAAAAQAVLAENVAILTGTLARAATNIGDALDPPDPSLRADAPPATTPADPTPTAATPATSSVDTGTREVTQPEAAPPVTASAEVRGAIAAPGTPPSVEPEAPAATPTTNADAPTTPDEGNVGD